MHVKDLSKELFNKCEGYRPAFFAKEISFLPNENGTIHIEEWMIAIFSVTNSRDLWLQLEWLNKETAPKVFQGSSWY